MRFRDWLERKPFLLVKDFRAGPPGGQNKPAAPRVSRLRREVRDAHITGAAPRAMPLGAGIANPGARSPLAGRHRRVKIEQSDGFR